MSDADVRLWLSMAAFAASCFSLGFSVALAL